MISRLFCLFKVERGYGSSQFPVTLPFDFWLYSCSPLSLALFCLLPVTALSSKHYLTICSIPVSVGTVSVVVYGFKSLSRERLNLCINKQKHQNDDAPLMSKYGTRQNCFLFFLSAVCTVIYRAWIKTQPHHNKIWITQNPGINYNCLYYKIDFRFPTNEEVSIAAVVKLSVIISSLQNCNSCNERETLGIFRTFGPAACVKWSEV